MDPYILRLIYFLPFNMGALSLFILMGGALMTFPTKICINFDCHVFDTFKRIYPLALNARKVNIPNHG